MKPARRRFLHLAASAAALPALGSVARAEPMRPLAERLLTALWALERTPDVAGYSGD